MDSVGQESSPRKADASQLAACSNCGKVLKDEHTLRCHLRTVHGEKKFACERCDKKFPTVGVLNAHLRTHSDILYACGTCGENFKDVAYFRKHVRAHSGERPYACQLCGRSYLQMSHLNAHMSLHTQVKQFTCTACPKCFRHATALKEHMNRHNNIKSHACRYCSYASSYRKNLASHLRTHRKSRGISPAALAAPCTEESHLQFHDDEAPVFVLVNLSSSGGLTEPPSFEEEILIMEEAHSLLVVGSELGDSPLDPLLGNGTGQANIGLTASRLGGAGKSPTVTVPVRERGGLLQDMRPLDLSLVQPSPAHRQVGEQQEEDSLVLPLRCGDTAGEDKYVTSG
jgi:DNA-directed RNA polymerase subunit RPC12/RpoP